MGYVEGLNDARTKLADFFSILLGRDEQSTILVIGLTLENSMARIHV